MEPHFYENDLVVVVPKKQYTINDVVLAEVDSREVLKRVQSVTKHTIYLLGDNTPFSTDSRTYGPVYLKALKGKVIFKLTVPKFIARLFL